MNYEPEEVAVIPGAFLDEKGTLLDVAFGRRIAVDSPRVPELSGRQGDASVRHLPVVAGVAVVPSAQAVQLTHQHGADVDLNVGTAVPDEVEAELIRNEQDRVSQTFDVEISQR